MFGYLVENYLELSWTVFITFMFIFLILDIVKSNHALKFLVTYGKTNLSVFNFNYIYVPKSFFSHFYAVSVLWSGLIFLDVIFMMFFSSDKSSFVVKYFLRPKPSAVMDKVSLIICFVLILCQGARRLYECLCVSIFSKKGKMIFLHYILGLYFYIMEPITILSEIESVCDLPTGYFEVGHVIGIVGCICAFYWQHQSATILASLRKSKHDDSYKIPTGGLFEYISSPHYFAEVLFYTSLTFIVGFHHANYRYVLAFVVVVHMGLAKLNHDWYLANFESYPKKRKYLIPFLA